MALYAWSMSGTIEDIALAAEHLRAGGLVAFPTETVYGLGADAFNEAAVARVYQVKGRPTRNPLIVHVSGPEMARRVVSSWPPEADILARAFWPGPLSIILPAARNVPPGVTGGGPTVAVRCPLHPSALALLFEFDGPLVGPSANLSGQVSPTSAEHVRESLGDADILILDGGQCSGGIESTVISLADPRHPRVLRAGLVGADDISAALARPVAMHEPANPGDERGPSAHGPLASPGTMDRHYAPRTPAHLFDAMQWPGVLDVSTGPAAVITHRLREVPPPHMLIAMPSTPDDYAAVLYAALRQADALNPAAILIERPPSHGPVWHAIADRLRRASSG
jgi:L-threonylcarbamoyladenylate synthase